MESLKVYNTVKGGVGPPYSRACGIPQGCPLSMTMVAFLMRPWVGLVKSIGAKPRVLADDIMVWEDGKNQEEIFPKYMNLL